MTKEEIDNIWLHTKGKAEGIAEAGGNADFPVLFANAILEYEMTSEVNKLAEWMVRQGYATGHGDSMDDLLRELEWQFKEKMERSWGKGVVDGRQIQMQTSVDKAVNAMAGRKA